jgi:HEAT repeat protein
MPNRSLPIIAAVLLAAFVGACASAPPGARKAQRLLDAGDYAGAERVASAELERYPRHASLWHIKMKAAMGRGDSDSAVSLYKEWVVLRGGETDTKAVRTLALTTLWRGLRVPSGSIRTKTIQAIERLEVEDLAEEVAELIADDDDEVAAAAAVALLKSHPQAPHLAAELAKSDSAKARAIAIAGIGRKVGKLARADLVDALSDRDAAVRRAAVTAVLKFAEAEDLDRLVTMAHDDPDGPLRARVIRGLANKQHAKLLELGQAALLDPYLGARLAGVHLLDKLGARDKLTEVAQSMDMMVAFRAAIAVHSAGGAPAVELMQQGVASKEWTIRASALNALDRVVSRDRALQMATAALGDSQVQVKLAAARLLMRLGDNKRAKTELLAVARGDDLAAAVDASIDLVRLGDSVGIATFEKAGASADSDLRRRAIRAHQVSRVLTTSLVTSLADELIENRIIAAEILLALTDED